MGGDNKFKVKLFADGADINEIVSVYEQGLVSGFTTNPTLMRKAGVKDYADFARNLLKKISDLPISFEVFSDDFSGMEREARKISRWGDSVYVKIPVTNTNGESSAELVRKLSKEGLKLNVTAIMTTSQVQTISEVLSPDTPSIVSVFAGRIADTGRDPIPIIKKSLKILAHLPHTELLWASSRELFNIFQADLAGCHIITVTNDILKKIPMIGRDLGELSLDTVKMFYSDARTAGYRI
ncbi:MAG: transaldolase [Candidatus Thermoplasmatota archaeon]|nr:transaldolase [Candidatus Thermoplasmatota archaeon]MCL6002394.1 transaldolase [Candidatus Thermoplasmatota archaeon]